METLAPSHKVSLDEANCEFHSKVAGFWNVGNIQSYFDAVEETCIPLIKARKPIYASIDFSDFVPQDQSTGEAIRDHLQLSQKFGLKRLAIIGASALVKIQYKRLSSGITVNFVENKEEAIAWLRNR